MLIVIPELINETIFFECNLFIISDSLIFSLFSNIFIATFLFVSKFIASYTFPNVPSPKIDINLYPGIIFESVIFYIFYFLYFPIL